MDAAINGYTAWSNMRLVREGCQANDILNDVMEGDRMKVLLQYTTGSAPKRMDSLDGLTHAQKVTRVDWFADTLVKSNKLPRSLKVDSQMFALKSADHVFPVFKRLVCVDVFSTWEIAPLFQKHAECHLIIAEPLDNGPCKIARHDSGKPMPFYISANGKSMTQLHKRSPKDRSRRSAATCLIELVNGQLKMTVDGRKLQIESLEDLIDSRVLCALVNSLVPGSFTTEVLLNDRWTINIALEAASQIFRVKSMVNSGDLYENDEEGMCAFLAYFIMSGYQFRQAQSVLLKLEELKEKLEDLQTKLNALTGTQPKQKKQIETKLTRCRDEERWINTVYDTDVCRAWVDHAKQVQAKIREKIAKKMQERFDVIHVSRPQSINSLAESLVINLSLTGGNGFYQNENKETLWTGRKMVIRDKATGEFFDDFSGSENPKGSVREMLKVHPYELVDINPTSYPQYELFFESSSRNKILKGGSRFLYQVFPGTTSQCQRLLLRAAKVGELQTVQKLIVFFEHERKSFVNCQDHETGNTALHLASRHGHFDIALLLLESGAEVNTQNSPGCTPFFLATEGLHKQLSQLLLEWGANIHIKNKVSKTALELIRNADLKEFLERKNTDHRELASRVTAGDVQYLEKCLKAHVTKQDTMASLRSRCVKGNTLFHVAVSLGSLASVEMILSQHVATNLVNTTGATPLHLARDPTIIKLLAERGAHVNATDHDGNTPLHLLCGDEGKASVIPDCISLLVGSGARMDVQNHKGLLPIHFAASHGLVSVINVLSDGTPQEMDEEGPPSLVYLSLVNEHLDCAKWLAEQKYTFKPNEADKLALRILNGPPPGCVQPVEVFRFLLENGANPNAEYTNNNRPLHISASLVTIPEITDMLLDNGAEIDAMNAAQATPLFSACKSNNPCVASKLIERGAEYWSKDMRGRCAFDYVKDHEDWIDSGYFTEDVRAKLKAFSLKHARALVQSISQVVKTPRLK